MTILNAMRERVKNSDPRHRREGRVKLALPEYMIDVFLDEIWERFTLKRDRMDRYNTALAIRAGLYSVYGCPVVVLDDVSVDRGEASQRG